MERTVEFRGTATAHERYGAKSRCGAAVLMLGASGLALCLAAALAPHASAQDTETAQAPASENTTQENSDVIYVTARRRQERLQDVPVSITTFSSDEIGARGFNNLRDLEHAVPNLVSSGVDTNIGPNISIRGISSDARNIGFETGVGVYVDGVFTGRPSSFNQDMFDVDRIEVLRGPQGTLFGKNTIAGAINIVTRAPDENLRASAELQYGNYNRVIARASVSGPLSDTVFGKIGLFHRSHDGFQTNTLTGADLFTENALGGRAQLRFVPSDALNIVVSVDAIVDDYKPNVNELEPGSFGFDEAPNNHEASVDAPVFQERNLFGASLTWDYELPNDLTLTSVSAYRATDTSFLSDDDATSNPFLSSSFDDEQSQYSQEFRLTSASGGRFEYVAGLYYFNQEVSTDRRSYIPPNTLLGPTTVEVILDATVETESYAVFGQFDYDLTDNLTFTGGARYTWEDKAIDMALMGSPIFGIVDLTTAESASDGAFSPTVGLSYRFSDSLNTYVKVTRGFKAGGFNADFVSADTIAFEPEFVTNYEVGVKIAPVGSSTQLNFAVFEMAYDDLQVIRFEQLAGFIITNAGEATLRGFEVDASAELFDGFDVSASLGYLDATFDSFKDGGGAGVDFDDNHLAYAPEWTFNITAQYEHDFNAAGSFFVRGEYSRRSSVFSRADNDPSTFIDGYDLLNGRIGYRFENDRIDVELWGRNLEDKDYINDRGEPPLGGFLGQAGRNFGAPRTYGVRLVARH